MSATTTQLLSSGEFCKLRYDTTPVKSAYLQTFLSIIITQKCQILSCDTLVAIVRYDVRSYTSKTHPLAVLTDAMQIFQPAASVSVMFSLSSELATPSFKLPNFSRKS